MRISDWSSDGCTSDLRTEPPAKDDSEHRIEDHVVGMAPRHGRAGLCDQFEQIPVADENPGEIGKRIPADGEAEDAERDLAVRSHQLLKVHILRDRKRDV